MSEVLARYGHVRGKVQGVWYRASTREQASSLGLGGWAKNCADGSVEVLLVGDREPLEKLEKWLWQGPENALVSEVELVDADLREYPQYRPGEFYTG